MINIPNYQIGTQIYESANSTVYQGVRKKDNQPVILKILKEDYPTPAELTRYSVSRFSKGQPPQCRDARPCVSTTDSTPFLEGVVMKVVHDQRGKRYIGKSMKSPKASILMA